MFQGNFKEMWAARKAQAKSRLEDGRVTVTYVRTTYGKIHVSCPFSTEFNRDALGLGGTWRRKTSVWVFKGVQGRMVIELCKKVYGEDAIDLEGFPRED